MRTLVLTLGLWLLAQTALAASQPDPFPQVADSYLVEIDGKRVWSKQPDRHLPPASLTKLMTALLALEHGQPDEPVTVTADAPKETGSRIGLRTGERLRLQDLLAAAMLPSANDACQALADHLAGDEHKFVARMNRRADELGMHDTHFTNACGHDEDEHHSTAHDLSLLAHAVLKHRSLLDITAQKEMQIATLDGQRHYTLPNKNALIGRYDGARGLKTGYTPNAGKCLVAYAKRGEHTVLLILLRGHDRWWDAVDILDLAFDHARVAP